MGHREVRITTYTMFWNEDRILPYYLRHYGAFAARMVFYDHGSTDDSRKLIESHPNTEIRPVTGKFAEELKAGIYNSCYKEERGRSDFVIVSDVDEFLYSPVLMATLENSKRADCTCFHVNGFQMISDRFPTTTGQIYEEVTHGVPSKPYSKSVIFDPRIDIHFGLGSHTCRPKGPARHHEISLRLLHFKFMGLDYTAERHYELQQRGMKKPGIVAESQLEFERIFGERRRVV